MSMITLPSSHDARGSLAAGPARPDRDWLAAELDPRGEYEEDDDLFGDDDDELGELEADELDGDELEDDDFESDLDV
jgi:hypothetical protein